MHLYMFPIDTMLTEFAVQHFTWWVKYIWKCLGSVFLGKFLFFCLFVCDFAGLSGSFHVFALFGVKAGGPTCQQLLRMFPQDKRPKAEFHSNNG